ncbi:hypothetical protein [Modestobacter sp. SSW1-42]|uniref:hypothetical protein n=1 Tax=Modestobacter sp. SSW1-42 TaxID=596372 RepID=UPI003985ED1A
MSTRMRAASAPAPPVWAVALVALLLTGAAAAVGSRGWPAPERVLSGWQVADVPPSTLILVVAAALICLAAGAALARPTTLPKRAAATWWLLTVASALALSWNALFSAAMSADDGPVIPVFHWLFTLVPALVVGLQLREMRARTQLRAAVGTAVITLPLFALGWALLVGGEGWSAVPGTLRVTAILGLVPLLLALAVARPWTAARR